MANINLFIRAKNDLSVADLSIKTCWGSISIAVELKEWSTRPSRETSTTVGRALR